MAFFICSLLLYIIIVSLVEAETRRNSHTFRKKIIVNGIFLIKILIPLTWFKYRKSYVKFFYTKGPYEKQIDFIKENNIDILNYNMSYPIRLMVSIYFMNESEEIKFLLKNQHLLSEIQQRRQNEKR